MRQILLLLTIVFLGHLTLSSQIVINEVIPPNTVEIKNLGGGTVNIANYWLCDYPNYDKLENLNVVCGNLNLGAGQIVAVTTSSIGISASDGEMGLYTMMDFDDPNDIVDYLQWGSGSHFRAPVAVAAGQWPPDGVFVSGFSDCASLEYDGAGNAPADWMPQDDPSSPCMENTLDGCDPGPMCDLTTAGLDNVACDDNGTPSDAGDDIITFTLNPQGSDLGAGYDVGVSQGFVNPTSGAYGAPMAFSLQAGSAGSGDVLVTVTDQDDGSCMIMAMILDPGPCSDVCDLTTTGLGNVDCDDNGSPSDPGDDIITFTLNPQGSGMGATYSVTVSSGFVNPTSGVYGGLENFSLQAGSAGSGNVTVTVTDDSDLSCTATSVIADPGSCSDACALTDAGLANVDCDDNGTPSDATDDVITFTLNPQGVNLGATYNVSVSSGAVNPTSAVYGGPINFSLQAGSAGSGNVTVTVTDADDVTCVVMAQIVDPGSCSNQCSLSDANLANVDCDDNGTSSDAGDDIITFTLDPQGVNLGATYNVSVSSGAVNPTSAAYGAPANFSLQAGSAGSGNVTVTVTDSDDGSCTVMAQVIDPGSCSGACNITDGNLANVSCDDNGTPSDAGDDIITFTLDPQGVNLGATYNVSVSSGVVNPTSAAYGAPASFSLQAGSAGSGNVTVTVTDSDDGSCTVMAQVIDPGSCSGACNITDGNLANVSCDDNDTPFDDTDDFIAFTLNPEGMNLGAMYNVAVSSGSIMPSSAAYGAQVAFALNAGSAGSGNVTVTISDSGNPACSLEVVVNDPGVCSACDVDGGMIMTGDPTQVCADDGVADTVDVVLSDNTGTNSAWVITDQSGVILSLPAGPPFSFEGAGAGICQIRHLSYEDGLTGLNVDANIDNLEGCYDFSNTISIVKQTGEDCNPCDADGGTISTMDSTTVCAGDGMPDLVDVMVAGNSGPNNAWIITDDMGTILMLPAAPPFDFDGAGAGTCRIWHISYEDGIEGLEVNGEIGNLMGCFDLSNSIEVTRLQPEGGAIATTDSTIVCVGDGTSDPISVTLTGAAGSNMAWVITDTAGTILSLPAAPPFDFEGAGEGICVIWNLSYEDGLTGLDVDNDIDDLTGCFDLSNGITVTRLTSPDCGDVCEVDGGIITTDSDTTICVGDGAIDSVEVALSNAAGPESTYAVTDEDGMILVLVPSSNTVFTFENAGAGTCVIYHVSYEDGLMGLEPGENIDSLEGCFDLSNTIEVIRVTEGDECISATLDPALQRAVHVYPNPTNKRVWIESDGPQLLHVEIFDPLTRKLGEIDMLDTGQAIELGDASGMYYLRIHTSQGVVVKKVMVAQ